MSASMSGSVSKAARPLLGIRLNLLLAILAILVVFATAVTSADGGLNVASSTSVIYDKGFVEALKNATVAIPSDSVIVASTNAPYTTYFMGHPTKIPFGVSSKEELVQYMLRRNYTYLQQHYLSFAVMMLKTGLKLSTGRCIISMCIELFI